MHFSHTLENGVKIEVESSNSHNLTEKNTQEYPATVENLCPQTAALSWNLSWEYDVNVPALSESVRPTNTIKISEEFCLSSAAFFFLKEVSAVEEYKLQRSYKIGELTHFEQNKGSFLKDKTPSYGWTYHSVLIALSSRSEVKFRRENIVNQNGTWHM